MINLANRRFVAFYFDLSPRGYAGDAEARSFVVAARKELGGASVPTPPLLFMTGEGKVVGEVSNYASPDAVLAKMLSVLKEHPQYDQPTEAEEAIEDPLQRAKLLFELCRYDEAAALLAEHDSDEARYLLCHLARMRSDFDAMEQYASKIDDPVFADDVRMERAYRRWFAGEFQALAAHLTEFPAESPRYTEARYFEGLAHYHQGDTSAADEIWKQTITSCSQDPWIYRADWAYTATRQRGGRFSSGGPTASLLNRIGYMGAGGNPDLLGPAASNE